MGSSLATSLDRGWVWRLGLPASAGPIKNIAETMVMCLSLLLHSASMSTVNCLTSPKILVQLAEKTWCHICEYCINACYLPPPSIFRRLLSSAACYLPPHKLTWWTKQMQLTLSVEMNSAPLLNHSSVLCLETMMLVGLWFMRVSDWRMPDSGDAVYFDCAFSESICLKWSIH